MLSLLVIRQQNMEKHLPFEGEVSSNTIISFESSFLLTHDDSWDWMFFVVVVDDEEDNFLEGLLRKSNVKNISWKVLANGKNRY